MQLMQRESSELGPSGTAPNNSMQRTALRAAADAERYVAYGRPS